MRKLVLGLLVLTCAGSNANGQEKADPRIVGHRGLIHHAPENTLAAFSACLELHLGFEVDVRRSRDGRLVCVHDATVDRTTDGKGKVSELSWPELQRLDAGRKFHSAFAGERIPTLDQVLALFAARGRGSLLALDIKDDEVEDDLVKLVQRHRAAGQVICIGFAIDRPGVRKKLRAADRSIGIGVLAQTEKDLARALSEPDGDWIYVRFVPTAEQVASVHKERKRVFIAGPTVAGMEEGNWKQCRHHGVDALLTDYPLECRRTWK